MILTFNSDYQHRLYHMTDYPQNSAACHEFNPNGPAAGNRGRGTPEVVYPLVGILYVAALPGQNFLLR